MRKDSSLSGMAPTPVWTGKEPCQKAPEVFHPRSGDTKSANIARWICGQCPSQLPCLEWALADPTLEGIHGGTTKHHRSRMRGDRR